MKGRIWSRRDFMSSGAIAGATIATMLNGPKSHAQFGKPQPLHDAHVSFVTTTESKPWQDAPVFNATFNWTMLNLNLESLVSDGPPMQGFGASANIVIPANGFVVFARG